MACFTGEVGEFGRGLQTCPWPMNPELFHMAAPRVATEVLQVSKPTAWVTVGGLPQPVSPQCPGSFPHPILLLLLSQGRKTRPWAIPQASQGRRGTRNHPVILEATKLKGKPWPTFLFSFSALFCPVDSWG